MTPFDQARAVYEQEPCARTFRYDLELHFLHGFVFCTPSYFIMGRPVDRYADHRLIIDPAFTFDSHEVNTWHIYLMAGNPSAAWSIMPYPLGWFSFERRNELRFYEAERIRRLSSPQLLQAS